MDRVQSLFDYKKDNSQSTQKKIHLILFLLPEILLFLDFCLPIILILSLISGGVFFAEHE